MDRMVWYNLVWYGSTILWYLESLSTFAPPSDGVSQVVVDGWFVKDEQIQEVDGDWVE